MGQPPARDIAPTIDGAITLLDLPIPLRAGVTAHVHVPEDLSIDEAERLCAFIRIFSVRRHDAAGRATDPATDTLANPANPAANLVANQDPSLLETSQ